MESQNLSEVTGFTGKVEDDSQGHIVKWAKVLDGDNVVVVLSYPASLIDASRIPKLLELLLAASTGDLSAFTSPTVSPAYSRPSPRNSSSELAAAVLCGDRVTRSAPVTKGSGKFLSFSGGVQESPFFESAAKTSTVTRLLHAGIWRAFHKSLRLSRVIDAIADPAERMILCPKKVAATCGISRRTLDRWIRQSTLKSTKMLFGAYSLAQAFDRETELRASSRGIKHGKKCPFSRALDRRFYAFTEVSFAELVTQFSPEQCASQILLELFSSDQPPVFPATNYRNRKRNSGFGF